MNIRLRPAENEDLAILDRIHRQNMRSYVEQNYQWNDNLFKNNFVSKDYVVMLQELEIIGFIKLVAPTKSSSQDTVCLYLGEIQIKSTYQNQGIGTKILKSIIEKNHGKYPCIWLRVLKGNPAIRLYKRLGFGVFAATQTHYKMQLIF